MKKTMLIVIIFLVGCATQPIAKDGERGTYKYFGPIDPAVFMMWEMVPHELYGGQQFETFHVSPDPPTNGILMADIIWAPNGMVLYYAFLLTDHTIQSYAIDTETNIYETMHPTEQQTNLIKRDFARVIEACYGAGDKSLCI